MHTSVFATFFGFTLKLVFGFSRQLEKKKLKNYIFNPEYFSENFSFCKKRKNINVEDFFTKRTATKTA